MLLAVWLASSAVMSLECIAMTTNIGVEKDRFGTTADGMAVDRYTLRNSQGMTVRLITYGATVTELLVPDRHGKLDDVALGFDNLGQYETERPISAARSAGSRFASPRESSPSTASSISLTINDPPHHLHGGTKGLSKVVWKAEPLPDSAAPAVKLTYTSPDGDQGYPGTLDVTVVYTLTEQNEMKIEYTADHGSADAGQPHAPHLLQPGRGRLRRRAGPRASIERLALHAVGRQRSPHRPDRAGERYAVRLPRADGHRQPA